MTNHPNRGLARLAEYGARKRTIDGATVIEMVDPNDGSSSRHQYRRTSDGGLEHRVLAHDGTPLIDTGSPWEAYTDGDLNRLRAVRGRFHPILDPLGL